MKTIFPYLLALTLGIILFLVWLDKPSGHDQLLDKQREFYLNRIDSLSGAYEEIIREKDSAAYMAFKNAEEGRVRWEARALRSEQNLKNEIGKRRVFTDSQTDSLLSAVR